MKIFNWVHRRFNNKAENAKRNGDAGGGDEHFPSDKKCDEVFERWGGGILTIGTLGYETVTNGYFFDDNNDGDGNGDDNSSVKGDINGGDDASDEKSDAASDSVAEEMVATETATEMEMEMEMEGNLGFGFEYMMMEKKERTTLADLFVADSGKGNPCGIAKNRSFDKPDLVRDKSSRKLIAKVDARPIHKLNKLMRRMMRRKIHPDVGPAETKVAAVNNNFDYNYNNNYSKTDDYVSLLPTQDTNI